MFKWYAYDAAINLAAQVFILFGGYISLFLGRIGLVGWATLVIIYSFILAKMMQSCIRKGADFKRYVVFVMLPPNIIALLAALPFIIQGLSELHIVSNVLNGVNLIIGLMIFLGSVAISLLAVFWDKVIFQTD